MVRLCRLDAVTKGMMMKLRQFFAFLSLGALLILSGCKMAILDPKGIVAASEKQLFLDAVFLMLLIVVPVIVMTLIFAWRYRARNQTAAYTPDWSHSTLLEIIWWSIPCIIIAILALMTWVSTHKLDPYRPLGVKGKPIRIQAIALDWRWLFIYPDQHIASINFVQIPINVPVRFYITADAPMNSLEIPQLAGQIYAMTGMRTKLNLMAQQPGDYYGLSTNFSGDGFSGMHFTVRASSEHDFNAWVNQLNHSANKLTMRVYTKLAKPSTNTHVEYFADPAKNLFNYVIMKYMGPMHMSHS